MTKRQHHILFVVTILLTAVSAVFMSRVNVNNDMTQYLPDDSQMKHGLELLKNEFHAEQMTGADVRVMFKDLDAGRLQPIADSLKASPDIDGVAFQQDSSKTYTLYELNVPKSVNQKSLGMKIRKDHALDAIVETSQDGNTPSMLVLVVAALLIMFILVLMARSWLEPLIFLIATGIAVVLNIGTNALLPSVSITTNYIVAILQMVLSLDYSIVLINRYRQEHSADIPTVLAANNALRKAAPSILSSALTTIVGLLMLCFMRLKIGMDMGLVLAKGVAWSLICTFTVMPSLLIIFHKGIENTNKKTFVLPTGRIGRYATRFRLPLSLFAVSLFVVAFIYSNKTDISFAMIRESAIAKVFPQKNPIVLIYDTKDEMAVIDLADSIRRHNAVELVVSHPTLLKQPYTAEQMTSQIQALVEDFSDYIKEPTEGIDQLTPELMKLVYYMKFQENAEMQVSFPEIAQFAIANCKDNKLFSNFIDDDMTERLAQLQSIIEPDKDTSKGTEEEASAAAIRHERPALPHTEPKPEEAIAEPTAETPTTAIATPLAPDEEEKPISVVSFMPRLHAAMPSTETAVLASIVDTNLIRSQMNVEQMSEFIGSTRSQTKMVFSFNKAKGKTMTPLEYVHFLADDLFQRRALASFVDAEQKKGLLMRMNIMDHANADKHLSVPAMTRLLADFGINSITEEIVKAIASPQPQSVDAVPDTLSTQSHGPALPQESHAIQQHLPTSVETDVTPTPSHEPNPNQPKNGKNQDERRAALFYDMMYSGKTYTSSQLAQNFKRLGYDMNPEMLSLLYVYYGCVNHYDETLAMSIEDLIDYGIDTLANDIRIAPLIDAATRERLSGVKPMLNESIGMMRNDKHSLMAVITNLPVESTETYAFIDQTESLCGKMLSGETFSVGESVMYNEMKKGFDRELNLVTILTVLAIFLIVAITFRSLIVPVILVMTIMTAVYVNVVFSGIISGHMLYLAYLIVQSILMGATIDYGILFTNYYKENRKSYPIHESVRLAYNGSIHTIMTSGLIMVAAPGAMALLVNDMAISSIVGSLAVGALVAVILVLAVLPGVLVAFDKWVVHQHE